MNTNTKMNRILSLFERKPSGVLSVYMMAGFPQPDDTVDVILALETQGADMIEIGIPFSDPMADGPVIQQSNAVALANGMTVKKLFAQLKNIRDKAALPLVMMGYLNPIMQYGTENFCRHCAAVGIDGIIIPDLPFDEYLRTYKPAADRYGLCFIMLITPETSADRIRQIDQHTNGFIYMVSTAATTGVKDAFDENTIAYFRRINNMQLKHPRLTGFGISNRATCDAAMAHSAGAIIGSSFIRSLSRRQDINAAVVEMFDQLRC